MSLLRSAVVLSVLGILAPACAFDAEDAESTSELEEARADLETAALDQFAVQANPREHADLGALLSLDGRAASSEGELGQTEQTNACYNNLEWSSWYCCGRFYECQTLYWCTYCPTYKTCQSAGTVDRYSPGCY